jgi:signal transduction histidine kinase
VDERKKRSIKTLLEQVEILNGIATSFSSFAKMPTPVLTKVNIADSLRKAVNLYANGSNGKVALKAEFDHEAMLGDEQLLIRIFSNLILNGLQSYQRESDASVEVVLTKKDNQCLISFSDRGVGISEEDKSKIFTPSFSTKKSGSGLGLAIAKQGIEYMNGTIWFESEVRMGAVFYIKLSLV